MTTDGRRWWESRRTFPKYLTYTGAPGINANKDTLLDDKWSSAHIAVGMVTSIPIFFIHPGWALLITVMIAILFEVYENFFATPLCKWIATWDRQNVFHCFWSEENGKIVFYDGDNFWHSCMDVLCNTAGFLIMFGVYALVRTIKARSRR